MQQSALLNGTSRIVVCWIVILLIHCGRRGDLRRSPLKQIGHHLHDEPLAPAAVTPGDSVYQLAISMRDQADRSMAWLEFRGQLVLIAMFYSHCTYTCPVIVHKLKEIERAVSDLAKGRLRILLVSLDPERDTPTVLKELANAQGLSANWSLLQVSPSAVQELAAVLGVRYRQLADGNFNHSAVITLLDAEGRMVLRLPTLQEPIDAMRKQIDELAKRLVASAEMSDEKRH